MGASSRARSLSPALRRSVSRLHSDADFYTAKKKRFKEELIKREEEYLHDTKDKWRNDMIRHRITGSSDHLPARTRSAPRSSVKVGSDLYAKDMKWKECRQKSLDTLAASIKEKKDKEEEVPTFQPKLATEEFNDINQISSVVGSKTRAAFLQGVAEQRQQQQGLGLGLWPGSGKELFRPKISRRSEMLAQKRRMVRETLDLSHLSSSSSPQQQQQDQQQHLEPREDDDSQGRGGATKSPGSGRKRAKSPSLFAHLYQVRSQRMS